MICVLTALTIASSTLIDLESVSGEWVSPDYTLSKEVLIEFSEHGPLFSNEDQLFVGSHVCYVDIEGTEKWRATILYEDRVILFQEDLEPIVTLFDFPVDNCSFSESGNYVVLHDGGAVDTDRNGLRINAETGESLFFDAHPEGLLGSGPFSIWDDGRMIFARKLEADLTYKYFFLNPDLRIVNSLDIYVATLNASSENFFIMAFAGSFHCYDSNSALFPNINTGQNLSFFLSSLHEKTTLNQTATLATRQY